MELRQEEQLRRRVSAIIEVCGESVGQALLWEMSRYFESVPVHLDAIAPAPCQRVARRAKDVNELDAPRTRGVSSPAGTPDGSVDSKDGTSGGRTAARARGIGWGPGRRGRGGRGPGHE